MQILEDCHLTDGRGRRVNFRNTVIILTSNIGAEEISKDKVLGFVGKKSVSLSDEDIENAYSSMEETLISELKNTLRPELINRLDDVVIFRSLTRKDARKIVKILLQDLNDRLVKEGVTVDLDSKVINYIVKDGFSSEYGARPLRRLLQDKVESVVAEYLLENDIQQDKGVVEISLGIEQGEIKIIK